MKGSSERKLEKNALFGDYRLVAKTPTGFHAQCILCGNQRPLARKQLRKNPSPTCYAPNCMKPEDKQDPPAKQPQYLSEAARKKLDATFSTFEANSKEARRLLKELQKSPETGLDRTSLLMLLDMVPFAERRYRQWSTQSNAYALNSLVEHARDIVRELDAVASKESLLRSLVVDSMHPCVKDIAQAMVDSASSIWLAVDPHIPKKDKAKVRDAVNGAVVASGRKVREHLENTRERILENVADPASKVPHKSKPRKPKRSRK